MKDEEKILSSINSGLRKPAIEALLGRSLTDDEVKFYKKSKAIYDLELRERRKTRKYQHLSGAEAKRKHDDEYASIDEEMNFALENINWERRNEAEKDLNLWIRTYCIGTLLDEPPPEEGQKVVKDMYSAVTNHSNYLVCLSRGAGKSSLTLCTTLYALATGLQKYIVIVSNNARAAGGLLSDLWRAIVDKDTAFAVDYPEVCLPFNLCNGSYRRKQTYNGIVTEIQKNSTNIVLATLKDKDGVPFKTSDSVVTVRGITSGIRGLKHGTMRPTCVLLDDLQTFEGASNQEQVQKIIDIINKDIIPLAGKERLSILQTATPIVPEDLVDKLRNDLNWKTTIYPAIMKFPKNMKLWDEYFKMFDNEIVEEKGHSESLDFYRQNREEMDAGSQVFNHNRFSEKDGHISALQKLLEIQHSIGKSAFQSEYQMCPTKQQYSIDITPNKIVRKTNEFNELEVPDGYCITVGAIDLNTSYCMTYSLVAFKRDTTGIVIGYGFEKCSIDQKLTDMAYNQQVYNKLTEVCRKIKATGIKIDGIAIDAGGKNWSAVCDFCKASKSLVGLNCCAFSGRASTQFNPYVRSRLRDAAGKTVLCGDAREQIKAGAGQKYVFFDADFYKEMAQRAFLNEVGSAGSLSLYKADKNDHSEFAIQASNERLRFVQHKPNGQDVYNWNTKEPHDILDTLAMCYAVSAQLGIAADIFKKELKLRKPAPAKKKIKFV